MSRCSPSTLLRAGRLAGGPGGASGPLVALGLLAAVLSACDSGTEARARALKDAARPAETKTARPAPGLRVVSLSPAASRFVVALEAADVVVGVDEASHRLVPALRLVPVVDAGAAARLGPTLVLVPPESGSSEPTYAALRDAGAEVMVFEAHDLDDAFALCRDVGRRLVGAARARHFEVTLGRALAQIGGASYGRRRPRVAALTDVEPVTLAGGHSFATDLIEIAGGTSVTHGGEDVRRVVAPPQLAALAPDLLLYVSARAPTDVEQAAIRRALPADYPVAFLAFDAETAWMDGSVEAAGHLREIVRRHERPGTGAAGAAAGP